ncbi:hypothetical protein KQ875_01905 [Mycoplasma zalophi]|uniref:Uncharacterized protein n=1 Tax=Mycoplasma zalophi TaxID=191287 RepID=A0ABS6DQC8_9MOLU|nr:hypothetical protein [Mycoplasma zalophi]MBU4692348.1 hypothetical protein [Mycoplasma zalophi]
MKTQKSKKIFLSLVTILAATSLVSVPAISASCTYKQNDLNKYKETFDGAVEYSNTLKEPNQQQAKTKLRKVLEEASRLALNERSTQADVNKAIEMILNGLKEAKDSLNVTTDNTNTNDNNDSNSTNPTPDETTPTPEEKTPEQKQNELNEFVNSIKESIKIKMDDASKANIKAAIDSNKNISFDKANKTLLTDNDSHSNDIELNNANWPENIELISTTTEDNVLSLTKTDDGKVVLSFRVLKSGEDKVISTQTYTIELGNYNDLTTTTPTPEVTETNKAGIYFKDKNISSDKLQLTYLIKEVETLESGAKKLKLEENSTVKYMAKEEANVQNNADLYSTNDESKKLFEDNIANNTSDLKTNFVSADAHLRYDDSTKKVYWNDKELTNAKYIGEFTTKSNLGSVKYYLIPKDLLDVVTNTESNN